MTLSEKNKIAKCDVEDGLAVMIDQVELEAAEEYEFTLLEGTQISIGIV